MLRMDEGESVDASLWRYDDLNEYVKMKKMWEGRDDVYGWAFSNMPVCHVQCYRIITAYGSS